MSRAFARAEEAAVVRAPAVARFTIAVAVLLQGSAPLFAQGAAAEPLRVGDITVSGSMRVRLESWDWFGGGQTGAYTYPGSLFRVAFGRARTKHDWQLELALPAVAGLPSRATGPQGPMGLGAVYFNANHGNTDAAMLFVKQAWMRVRDLGGVAGQSLKVGRMEFFEGAEVVPKNTTLAALKRDRIAQRLLGNFGFTHVGRSLDGVQYAIDRAKVNFTTVGARPTRGVFQVDGWGELNVNVFYLALTRQLGDAANAGEWRLFGLQFDDRRRSVVKTDNRLLAARQADRDSITVGTFGGHYLRVVTTRSGPVDLLIWGAAQAGSWGELGHRAGAFAAEAGWQPRVTTFAPWIRGGFDYGSGDKNSSDATHGTFFQVLPTPRQYARFPFFNAMNTRDAFGELIVRPSQPLSVRADIHALWLADVNDLWYQGGGAFQPGTFGYIGTSAGSQSGLATLYDFSGDYAVNSRVSLAIYYSYAVGGPAMREIYPSGDDAHLGYVELQLRF